MAIVVVTGVAGSLGRRVAQRLGRTPGIDRVIGIDSSDAEPPPGVEMHLVDLAAPGATIEARLASVLRGADGVIHLAWRTADGRRPSAAVAGEAAAANHLALRRVTDAVAAAGVGCLVHLSSATVYGAWPDNPVPLTEDAPLRPNPELAFAVGKADAERHLADWAEDHPAVDVAVLRPAVTVGSPERPLYRALGGTGSPRGDDAVRPVQYLHVDDLADAAVWAWERRLRGPYNVAPDGGLAESTARDLAGGLARIRLPGPLARFVGAWTWRWSGTGAPADVRAYATEPWIVAPDRLLATGWQPGYTSEEALVATDDRAHWDDLPPGKRQNYTLLAVITSLVVVSAGAVGVVWMLLRRRRAQGPVAAGWLPTVTAALRRRPSSR